MTEEEGRKIAAILKWGEPNDVWSQDRPNTLTTDFGLVDVNGQTIKGLSAEFEVFVSPTNGYEKFVFSLKRFELGRTERAYQLEINRRPGIRATDHSYSHEHYGESRFVADLVWALASFEEAVERFRKTSNITFTVPMPHFQEFNLR